MSANTLKGNAKQFLMQIKMKKNPSLPGLEPGTFGLEVQRAIHCATGTLMQNNGLATGKLI